jgi:Fe-S-cluster containining protein
MSERDEELEAGEFAAWAAAMQRTLDGGEEAKVPCGECVACCTSSQFVHIAPDETETLARIPKRLRFPAPGLPRGHVLLGYDERGHCPMFVDGKCAIYAHRPRTCRTYDCRIFPAAAIVPDSQERVARQAARWRFRHGTAESRAEAAAVRAAAEFLSIHKDALPAGSVPAHPTARAVLAFRLRALFVDGTPALAAVAAALAGNAVRRRR